ncbi:MAG: sugar phosphate isomerase/epimerase, partial [Kiritimatiellia bacterium]|nr:sugar phosphate isomerase/epimerase [Kiritimatiellia bacterium]
MASKPKMGLQLYSLRTMIEGHVPETLRALSRMGYKGVEFAGTYNLPAAELRKMLDDAGLVSSGAHVSMQALSAEQFEKTAEMYRTLGTDRLIVPWIKMDDMDAIIDELNAI